MNKLENYFDRLWPICRSILGPGYRESLLILNEWVPMQKMTFPTGQKAFDWTVPKEWVIRDAYFIAPNGKKHAEFKKNNLHVLNYSAPFSGKLPLSELQKHLHSLPDNPDAVPYLTSYYRERWGFCLTHRERASLQDGEYQVRIDSELKDGFLEIGEAVLPGESDEEIFFSSYLCHPSLANNELSGPLVLAGLYEKIRSLTRRRFTYRFVLAPETIGAVCYLSARGAHLKNKMKAGYLLTCLGGGADFTYKLSRRADTLADRAARAVLTERGVHTVLPFDPSDGSDDRQYCSPGFDLPFGTVMRSMYGRYAEYHTSLDNKKYLDFAKLESSTDLLFEIVQALESNHVWKNTVMHGEPQLGKRGLYPSLGSQVRMEQEIKALLWLLNFADGQRDLLAIAEISRQPLSLLRAAAVTLSKAGLLVLQKFSPEPSLTGLSEKMGLS